MTKRKLVDKTVKPVKKVRKTKSIDKGETGAARAVDPRRDPAYVKLVPAVVPSEFASTYDQEMGAFLIHHGQRQSLLDPARSIDASVKMTEVA